MRLESLELVNFKNLTGESGKFVFKFPREFILQIYGPNGSGKSSFVEAIPFVLFGEPIERLSKKLVGKEGLVLGDYLTRGQKSATFTLEFEIDDAQDGKTHHYKIVRKLRAKADGGAEQYDATLHKDGAIYARKVTSVNESIKKIVQIDIKAMLSSNFVTQKDLMGLGESDYKDWERAINVILNLESFTRAKRDLNKTLRDELKPRETEVSIEKGTLEIKKNEMIQAERNFRHHFIGQYRYQKKIRKLEQEIIKFAFIEPASENLTDLNKQSKALVDAQKAVQELQNSYAQLGTEYSHYNTVLSEIRDLSDVRVLIPPLVEKIATSCNNLKDIKETNLLF